MIRETELESLIEKERTEKAARKEEERKRAAERLAKLGGFESVEEMEGSDAEEGEFAAEYEGEEDADDSAEGDEE